MKIKFKPTHQILTLYLEKTKKLEKQWNLHSAHLIFSQKSKIMFMKSTFMPTHQISAP